MCLESLGSKFISHEAGIQAFHGRKSLLLFSGSLTGKGVGPWGAMYCSISCNVQQSIMSTIQISVFFVLGLCCIGICRLIASALDFYSIFIFYGLRWFISNILIPFYINFIFFTICVAQEQLSQSLSWSWLMVTLLIVIYNPSGLDGFTFVT